ncbi:MAG TPA: rhodanese-like domain-containing protein [Phototrophicaceae bacterium]|nr:rhodanese-like domain-containing protein [Phototrophicaceae bacterium]
MNQPGGQFENVDIETYREQFHPGDHLLVDVREIDEWVLGHIPGAVHIPLNDLPERLAEIPTDKPVVVVCATGGRSLYGSQFLLESGYSQVYNLEGGTMGWLMKRLPIER